MTIKTPYIIDTEPPRHFVKTEDVGILCDSKDGSLWRFIDDPDAVTFPLGDKMTVVTYDVDADDPWKHRRLIKIVGDE